MKKTLLLFLFLPFIGFTQTDLVKWNAASNSNRNTPEYNSTLLYPTATVSDFSVSGGVSLSYNDSWEAGNPFFMTGNWPNAQQNEGSYDAAKYIEFRITPTATRKIDLSSFYFTYRSQGGSSEKFQIQYSKDNTFTNNVKVLVPETISSTNWTTINPAFSTEINPVLPGEIVYVRVYVYNSSNNFHFRTGVSASNTPPVLRGTTSTFDSTKILAVNDYLNTKKEVALNISPLSNDVNKTKVTSIVISAAPSATTGTAIINPDKTITFNPAKNFTGKSTFKYTISDGTISSEATIEVTVADVTSDALVIWDAKTSTDRNKPTVNSPYISAGNLTNVGIPAIGYNNSEDSNNPFYTTGSWPNTQENGGSNSPTKYVQFSITADANHKVDLTTFGFTYRAQGGSTQRFKITYSKSSNFSSNVKELVPQTTASTNWTTINPSFASDLNTLAAGETIYFRLYVYNTYDNFHFRTKTNIKGSIKDVNTLTANDDAISTHTNVAVVIPILANDVIGGSALQAITVTQPTNGTVTVNGTTNITFTPASNFTGAASFTYTLRNANSNYSSATVNVNGTAPICTATPTAGINYWKGFVYTYTGNAPAATTYVGSLAEKAIFDRNIGEAAITGDTSVEPNNFCGTAPTDKFLVRYLMQTSVATTETYGFNIGGDDGVRLYIDGNLVNVSPANSWGDHSYVRYAAQYTLTAGTHNFVLEYYENAQSARVSFSYGAVKGDTTFPYGNYKWNVYGFTLPDISLIAASYAGTYVDTNLNINTQSYWNKAKSPSYATTWQGAPIDVDQFAVTYKRQGFPCGRYQIQLVNCDDVAEVYIDGVKIFTQNGYTTATSFINNGQTYPLNKNSKVEVRLREDGGDANVAFNFVDAGLVYDGTSNTIPAGSSIVVNTDTTLSGNLEVCSCTVASGKIFTIPADLTLTVNESIIVNTNGKIVVKNNGSLVQTNNDGTYTGSADSFEMNRTSKPMKNFDYTYWSSPVIGQKINVLSPNTLSDKYMSFSGTNWFIENGNNIMRSGKGYIIRVPKPNSNYTNGKDYWTGTTYEQPVTFVGVPNNGIIIGEALNTNTSQLLGNPYPSALDANAFLSNPNNSFLKGTIYFWTHNTAYANNKYTSDDYAAYNRLGGLTTAKAKSSDKGTNKDVPNGNIAAGQSFFAIAKTAGNAYFDNSMRVVGNNTQFFKTANLEKHRIWLNLTNEEGAFKQTLIGYVEGATNDFDNDFDGSTFNQNAYINFYSVNQTSKYAIQGRALPLDYSDVVPLGYSSTIAGDFTIAIDNADGDLANHSIFLEDKTLGTTTDLSKMDYKFNSAIGTFNDRFVLRYTNKTLGTGDFETSSDAVLVGVQNKTITINSTKENIDTVYIYDISGKLLYNKKKVGDTQLTIGSLGINNQVIFIKVVLENEAINTVKSMFK